MEIQVENVEVTVAKSGGVNPVNPTPPPAIPEFTGKPGNINNDLQALAEEMAVNERAHKAKSEALVNAPIEPKAVEPEQPATAPVTPVPDKFVDAEGKPDTAKIEKSTLHAEEAYQKYQEIERKLRQKQNEVAALKIGAPVPVAPVQAPQNFQLSPFEIQVAQDLINEAAALGYQMPQAQAIAQAKVQVRLMEAKHSAEINMTQDLRNRLDEQDRRKELEGIKENDPWVLSPEGIETLSRIRETRPHVNASNTPWTAAYREHLADQVLSQRLSGQVQTPTPTAKTVKAPPTPVNAAPRVVQPSSPDISKMSSDEISQYVRSLSPEAEQKFWQKQGLRFK